MPDDTVADPRADRPGSTAEHALQQRLGTAARADRFYADQVCDHLLPTMDEFVARMSMVFVASSDADGACDSSVRVGPPGFVAVLDPGHLAWPEHAGDASTARRANVAANPHVGLLMVDFVEDLIGLHVNGRATVCPDAALRAEHPQLPAEPVPGRAVEAWVVVEVEEAYIHCRKHIPRMRSVDGTGTGATAEAGDPRRRSGDFFGAARSRGAEGTSGRTRPGRPGRLRVPAAEASPAG